MKLCLVVCCLLALAALGFADTMTVFPKWSDKSGLPAQWQTYDWVYKLNTSSSRTSLVVRFESDDVTSGMVGNLNSSGAGTGAFSVVANQSQITWTGLPWLPTGDSYYAFNDADGDEWNLHNRAGDIVTYDMSGPAASFDGDAAKTPEPGTLGLCALGLALLALRWRRR